MPNPFLNGLFIRNLRNAKDYLNDAEKADVICIYNKIVEHCLFASYEKYGKITARINSEETIRFLKDLGFLVQKVEDNPELNMTYDIYITPSANEMFKCRNLDTAEEVYQRIVKQQVDQVIKSVSQVENLTVSVSLVNPDFRKDVINVLIGLGYYILPDEVESTLVNVSLVPFSKEENKDG